MATSSIVTRSMSALKELAGAPAAPAPPPPQNTAYRVAAANLPRAFSKLPTEALALVEDISVERDEALSVARFVRDQFDAERAERGKLQVRRAELTDRGRQVRPLAADDPTIVDCDAQIEASNDRIAKLQSRFQALEGPAQNTSGLLRNLETYMRQLGALTSDLWTGEPGGLRKGETTLDAIERCQRRCRELIAGRDSVQAAPYPAALAIETEIARIEALAQRGAPDASRR